MTRAALSPVIAMSYLSKEQQATLVARAAANDWSAFSALKEAFHAPLVGHLAVRIWAGAECAEDLADAVWEDAREKLGRFDASRNVSFYTFLVNVVAPRHVTRFNRERARTHSLDDDAEGRRNEPPGSAPTPPQIEAGGEELRLRARAFHELFRITFLCGGYPHEQLAFAYSQHIYGTPSPRGMEGVPRVLEERHGATPLGRLLGAYWEDYQAASCIADPAVLASLGACLDPVRRRMPLIVDDLLRFNEARKTYPHALLAQEVGESSPGDYWACYKGGAGKAISNWCEGVKRSVRRVLGLPESPNAQDSVELEVTNAGSAACPRCKLRHVAPCAAAAPAGVARAESTPG